ncbi:hypothetical protein [Pseudogemmobacter bohemicus]|uniref:hypothetical protein n=1 Tax=Pseudogemmobacter bohemicus TaxID=2250708 RepID=UPI000DD42DE8|nr:hypothetical protein [Pseudogemmobacter bohemicus]
MKIKTSIAAIFGVIVYTGTNQTSAQEMSDGIFQVANGESQKIDRFGVCRIVKNNGENPIMIPAGSREQWADGAGSFIGNISQMAGISAIACANWWEGRTGGTAEFSLAHMTTFRWRDGTYHTTFLNPNSPGYVGFLGHEKNPAANMAVTQYYNADTGECAPAKSYLGTGLIVNARMSQEMLSHAIVQLCDSDGIASPPLINMETIVSIGQGAGGLAWQAAWNAGGIGKFPFESFDVRP